MKLLGRPLDRAFDPSSLFAHGGGPLEHGVLDFSVNLNPLGPPRSVLAGLREHLSLICQYPDPECKRLRATLAEQHGVPVEAVLAGNGASELIDLIARVAERGRAAVVEPTYTEYLRSCLLAGRAVDHWLPASDNFRPESFDPNPAELVWLGNPNNPTGNLWPSEKLREWVQSFPEVLFVVDEAFLPFRSDEPLHTLVPLSVEVNNLIVVRSLTKFLAVPGLRLGYLVGPPAWVDRLRRHQPPWSVNGLAQLAGEIGLRDAEFARQTKDWCEQERRRLFDELRRLSDGLEVFEPSANFMLLRVRQGDARALATQLLDQGVRVRVADNFVGLDHRFLRVAVRTRQENERLVEALHTALAGGS